MLNMESLAVDAADAGATIRPELVIAEGESSSVPTAYEPTTVHSSIVEAARYLRKHPGASLAKGYEPKPVADRIGDKYQDAASQMLIGMIDSSIESAEEPGVPSFRSKRVVKALGMCARLEEGFGMAFAQMRHPDEPLPGQTEKVGYELITGRNGEVVAVGKGFGQPSALTLKDISINGVRVPAGSALRADTLQDRDRTAPESLVAGEGHNYAHQRVVPLSHIEDIALLRMTGFAVDPSERQKEFPGAMEYANGPNADIMRNASLDDLRRLADAALVGAGLEYPEEW